MDKFININNLSTMVNKHLENNKLSTFPIEKYNLENILEYIHFKKNDYYKNIIYKSKLFEIIIISWWKGCKTNFHNHPKNGCILKVIFGQLQENLLTKSKNTINIMSDNDYSYLDDSIGIHQIEALTHSLSLHIYSPSGFYDK